jgi:HEAT repeat protein
MSTPFLVLRWLAVAGLSASPILAAERNPETVRALITVLQSNAPVFDKARACQQLGEFGDRTAVPALAALLADEQLGAYARSGLEGIPDPAAAEALRAAASTLQGLRLAGAVNSLGVLRDAKAVGLLTRLARDPAAGVAREALLALGCIATDDALPVLREALRQGPGTNREAAASACLLAAERRLTDRDTAAAVRPRAAPSSPAIRTASRSFSISSDPPISPSATPPSPPSAKYPPTPSPPPSTPNSTAPPPTSESSSSSP